MTQMESKPSASARLAMATISDQRAVASGIMPSALGKCRPTFSGRLTVGRESRSTRSLMARFNLRKRSHLGSDPGAMVSGGILVLSAVTVNHATLRASASCSLRRIQVAIVAVFRSTRLAKLPVIRLAERRYWLRIASVTGGEA